MFPISSMEGLRKMSVSTEGNLAATLIQVGGIKAVTMGLEKRVG